MKITIASALLMLCSSLGFALDQNKIDGFCAALKHACDTRDIDAIKKLYHAEGASEPLLDQSVHEWEVWLLDFVPKQNWTVAAVEFYSKTDYLARPEVNKSALAGTAEPVTMNGHVYGPNLDVIGFVSVKFKQGSGGSMSRLSPVGFAPDGSLRIASKKRM